MNFKNLVHKNLYDLGLKFGFNRNFVSALCYHSISGSKDFYSTALSKFKTQIELLNKSAKFLNLNQLENILQGKKIDKWGIVLTIDDGYEDVKKILSFTMKRSIPVILFVLSDPKNANRNELANNHKLLSLIEIKKLYKLGWEIGCHSATHPDLTKLSLQDLKNEIIGAKKDLEKELGFKINCFAYPKGAVNSKALQVVKKAGYKFAFTTQPGTITSKTNPLLIPRTVITKSRKLEDFPYFISETGLLLQQSVESLGIWKILSKFKRL